MLILPDLNDIKLPDDPAERKNVLNLHDKPSIRRNFLSLLQDVLLLPYGTSHEQDVPPGMSVYSFKRVIINNWKAEDLENVGFSFCLVTLKYFCFLSNINSICRSKKALCV